MVSARARALATELAEVHELTSIDELAALSEQQMCDRLKFSVGLCTRLLAWQKTYQRPNRERRGDGKTGRRGPGGAVVADSITLGEA